MANPRFNHQIGAATRFKKGHKGLGGRPRTSHLVKMFEALAKQSSNPKAPIWDRTNVAQAVVLEFGRQAMRGSARHAEIFLRLIQPHLSKLLNAGRFGRILAEALEEIRKGRQPRPSNAHVDAQAAPPQAPAQRIRRIVRPEPTTIWDEIYKPKRESYCLNEDHPTLGSWRR